MSLKPLDAMTVLGLKFSHQQFSSWGKQMADGLKASGFKELDDALRQEPVPNSDIDLA